MIFFIFYFKLFITIIFLILLNFLYYRMPKYYYYLNIFNLMKFIIFNFFI